MAMMPPIYDLARRVMQTPEFQMAYQGVAGQTAPAMRAGAAMAQAPQPVAPMAPPAPVPVPGQSAQAVVPAGGDDRIAQAFRDLGVDPNLARVQQGHAAASDGPANPQLQAALEARAAQQRAPATAPAPRASGGAGFVDDIMSGLRTADQRSDAGPIGRFLPQGIRNPLADALSALSVGDPSAPPLTALGTGFAAAQAGKQSRLDRKRQEQLAEQEMAWKREDRAYQRERDQAADTREDRRLSLEERRAERDERKSLLDEISTAAGIQYTQAQTNKIIREYESSGLTVDQLIKVEGLVNDRIAAQLGDFAGAEDRDAVMKDADEFRKTLIEQFKSGGNVGEEPAANTTEVPQSEPAGTGTAADPIEFPANAGDAESILDQRYKETGQPVYFRDETGALREYVPGTPAAE